LAEGGASQETVDRVANEVRVLEAEEALLDAQIARREVRAPFGGTVGLRQVSEGAYLGPGAPIATLRRLDPIKLDLAVPEGYAGRVAVGQTLTFVVRGTDAARTARVYAVEPGLDPDTRTLRLRARAPNPDRRLRPGAFADVTLTLGAVDSALVVPSFAVVPALGTQRVFVADAGRAAPRNVTLGVRTDSTVQITSGLAPEDTVLTSNIQDVRAGLPVKVRLTNAE
jgi:membrane fusion protein (multidrug efflux system)